MKEQVRHPDQFTLISYFFWSAIDCRIIFSHRSTSLECCCRDEILPVESHLLLLSVVLFVPYFSSSISRARRLLILCFAVSDWWPLSTCLYRRDIGTSSVLLSAIFVLYCHISVCFYGNSLKWFVSAWMVSMAIDPWWLGSVLLSSVLLWHCGAARLLSSSIIGAI